MSSPRFSLNTDLYNKNPAYRKVYEQVEFKKKPEMSFNLGSTSIS